MSEHVASVSWKRETPGFDYDSYSRDHVVRFESGIEVPASAAPAFLGNPERVDPESAFVAALASCHMLTFLALCSRRRIPVESYADRAVGHLEKNEQGKSAVTRVELHPSIVFGGERAPSPEELRALHERAHAECFIANSVLTRVTVA